MPGGRKKEDHVLGRTQELDDTGAQERYEEEGGPRGIGALHQIRSCTRSGSNEIILGWGIDDPENPYSWSKVSFRNRFHVNLMTESFFTVQKGLRSPHH